MLTCLVGWPEGQVDYNDSYHYGYYHSLSLSLYPESKTILSLALTLTLTCLVSWPVGQVGFDVG
jgi:hypothetical protein